MKFSIKVGEEIFEIEIVDEGERVKVKVRGKEFIFEKEESKKISLPSLKEEKELKKREIQAPITGIISEIFVTKGKMVKKGEKLCLLSAMKMENEICSDFDGEVKEIFIQKGQKVEKGQKLFLLEENL